MMVYDGDWADTADELCEEKAERDEWRSLARRLARIVEAEARYGQAQAVLHNEQGRGWRTVATDQELDAASSELAAARAAVTDDELARATAAEDA